jgi:hypothetical protein
MPFLRYAPDIERFDAQEQQAIDGIIQGMSQQTETVERLEGHAVRASHAKSSACVVGELVVPEGLPPELAQGLFAKAGSYPVAVRFAQGPGETLGDRVSTHRGMAIKVFGVDGPRIAGHDVPVQDFVLASGTTFPAGTAQGFLDQARKIGTATPMPEGVKSAVSSVMRTYNKLLNAVAGGPSPTADFYGHPFSHPLVDYYFSQCPMRWGDYVAKVGAYPSSVHQEGLKNWQLAPHEDEDGFRHAACRYFHDHDAVFELRAQLWANADTQPIEDASVEWPAGDSVYRTVATIRLPRQDAYSPERVRYFDDRLIFRPAHSLEAHRPLGSVMRARLQVYAALSALRHRDNGVAEANPATPEAIPA